jgi:hypothetical protein
VCFVKLGQRGPTPHRPHWSVRHDYVGNDVAWCVVVMSMPPLLLGVVKSVRSPENFRAATVVPDPFTRSSRPVDRWNISWVASAAFMTSTEPDADSWIDRSRSLNRRRQEVGSRSLADRHSAVQDERVSFQPPTTGSESAAVGYRAAAVDGPRAAIG